MTHSFIHSFTSCTFMEHPHARPCAWLQEWLEKADTFPALLVRETDINQVITQITTKTSLSAVRPGESWRAQENDEGLEGSR